MNEWWRTAQIARDQRWARADLIEFENDASHYQVEDSVSNRSHKYEVPPC
ncbi:GH-E family nuclease [Leifsonia sp. ALI-44-B]